MCVDATKPGKKLGQHKRISKNVKELICRFLVFDGKAIVGKDEGQIGEYEKKMQKSSFFMAKFKLDQALENLFDRTIIIAIDDAELLPFVRYELSSDEHEEFYSLHVTCTLDFTGPDGEAFLKGLLQRAIAFRLE